MRVKLQVWSRLPSIRTERNQSASGAPMPISRGFPSLTSWPLKPDLVASQARPPPHDKQNTLSNIWICTNTSFNKTLDRFIRTESLCTTRTVNKATAVTKNVCHLKLFWSQWNIKPCHTFTNQALLPPHTFTNQPTTLVSRHWPPSPGILTNQTLNPPRRVFTNQTQVHKT